ncbi:carbamoyltransferase HypF [bacterium]|nr:carbamoyltransferase HypF [bacterium]MBU1959283.1 carbamoyltransferase HypF [bacterium]
MIRERYFIEGLVQGVGFRPFIYKIAHALGLTGFVKNSPGGVEIEVEGKPKQLQQFEHDLRTNLPPLARIDTLSKSSKEPSHGQRFDIIQTQATGSKIALVSPDVAVCSDCLADIKEQEKYHNYFATNCTNCGPRYSIIQTVPYDRVNTSMASFIMCPSCQAEYTDPLNRRYHAQPVSCYECGPSLTLQSKDKLFELKATEIIQTTAKFINEGKLIAIKGIGGFHLVCDGSNSQVIERLRDDKNRPTKPFALMCKDLEQIKQIAYVNTKEEELLSSKEAPIVILKKRKKSEKLSKNIAPNIDRIGCFLPYTPLHHLLFEHLESPIIATSANLGDEPIIIHQEDIFEKLPFVDVVLDFNRDIVNGVDDSLLQVVGNTKQTLRLARGYAPKVIKLPFKANQKILAVGANAKNSIAFAFEDSIIVSPHIGDLDSLVAFDYFERTIETFKRFYDFEADIIVHDKHPNYHTTRWAKAQNRPLIAVQHHLAHVYACKAEFGLMGDYLGFSFDGMGYGDDGTLWGGEVFLGDERKYTFKPIKLLGGVKAIKEPRRVALSMLFDELGLEEVLALDVQLLESFHPSELKILHQSYSKNLNAPLSSSVGRLFDAVASLSNVCQTISYEGESGLLCESFYTPSITECFPFTIEDGVINIKIIQTLLKNNLSTEEINSMFINSLVEIIIQVSKLEQQEVILTGGVFQNKTLLELVTARLKKENIVHYYQQETAINDGGIALGQLYWALTKLVER